MSRGEENFRDFTGPYKLAGEAEKTILNDPSL